jgi:hypothetical protein
MSNLTDLLNDVHIPNAGAVGVVGSLLGAAADVSGAAGLIDTLVSSFNDKTAGIDSQLGAIRGALQTLVETVDELNGRTRWDDINRRLGDIDRAFAPAAGVLGSLADDLAASPPLDEAARSQRAATCYSAAYELMQSEHWDLPSTDLAYYQDPWNLDLLQPVFFDSRRAWPPMMDVFYDVYVLPQYLRAVAIYLLVLRAFYPDEQVRANHADTLIQHMNRLQEVHDASAAGIHHMKVPIVDGWRNMLPDDGPSTQVYEGDPHWTLGQPVSAYRDEAVEYYQPVGAVHVSSGYSASAKFPPYPDGQAITTDMQGMVAKVAFATRVRWKDVYLGTRLTDVWDGVNQLRVFLGQPQVGGDRGRWWSLRELYSMLTYPLWQGLGWPTTWWQGGLEPYGLSDGSYNDHTEISAKDTLRRLYLLSGLPPDPAFPGETVTLSLRTGLHATSLREPVEDLVTWWNPPIEPP